MLIVRKHTQEMGKLRVPGFENQNPLVEDKDMQAREIILTFGLGMSPRGPKIRATCTLKQQQHGKSLGPP
jgi:hypothetical protein